MRCAEATQRPSPSTASARIALRGVQSVVPAVSTVPAAIPVGAVAIRLAWNVAIAPGCGCKCADARRRDARATIEIDRTWRRRPGDDDAMPPMIVTRHRRCADHERHTQSYNQKLQLGHLSSPLLD